MFCFIFFLFPLPLVQNKDAYLISLVLVSDCKETWETLISLFNISRFNLREVRDGTLYRDLVILFYARDGGRISSLSPRVSLLTCGIARANTHTHARAAREGEGDARAPPPLPPSCSRLVHVSRVMTIGI